MVFTSDKIGKQTIDVSNIDFNLREAFEEFTLLLLNKFGKKIESIVVFGSAATGEWIRGKSDIDFIIVTESNADNKEVENFANQALLIVDAKYNLKLRQTCSSFKREHNIARDAVHTIESFMTFGKPFFVLSRDQIDLEKGIIRNARIRFVTSIFDSIAIFAAKIIDTGSVIYGENLLSQLHVNRSPAEKVKAMLAPFWLVLMSFAIFPIDDKLALSHSVKATLWACEDTLFFIDEKLASTETEVKKLKIILSDFGDIDLKHLESALHTRRLLAAETKIEKSAIIRFLVKTPLFIITLYRKIKSLKIAY